MHAINAVLRKLFKMQPLIDLLLETVSAQLIATLFRHKKTDFLCLISEQVTESTMLWVVHNIARCSFMSCYLSTVKAEFHQWL